MSRCWTEHIKQSDNFYVRGVYSDEQKAQFRKEAFIPDGVSLELDHFGEFYEKRKELLKAKLRQLLG